MKFLGHLHTHTEYSPLDGLAKIEELVIKAKECGQEFIAITDHGSSSGLYEATKVAEKHNFKVLLGEEFYFENADSEVLKTGHLVIIAKNQEGLKNLFRLQKLAYENFYYKPRINLKMLEEFHEGLICTTACIANQVGQYILKDEPTLALKHIFELQNIFGDDFYVEMQSSSDEKVIKVNKQLIEFCEAYNFKPVLTNDIHYVNKEDYSVHEVLLAIQQVKKMSDEKRWKFEHNDFWLKTQEEMEEYCEYFPRTILEACYKNLAEIVGKCEEVRLEKGNYLPKPKDVEDADAALEELTTKQYFSRVKERGESNKTFYSDLWKELSVIKETGYSGYFLVVHEYINWAKQHEIQVGDGRGSGAGSKVAYTIGITEINPQKYDLLFERFLTPGREPDFDVDFSDIDAVYKHLQEVYGKDNVARVGAISRFTAKSAIRKVMSTYGFNMKEIAEIIDLLPQRLSFTLEEAMNESERLNAWLHKNDKILKAVEKLEGIMDHFSTHAGGVIIWENLSEILPVMTDREDREKWVVAADKHAIEELGHYKFDVLGLKSLILMKDILDYTGDIDWSQVDFEDDKVYDMLCSGDVTGVFQLSEQRDKVMEQQPRCFEDLIAINALIRPGVGDWKEYISRRKKEWEQDELTPYMNSTRGIIVYQEQYLLLAQTFAGWDIAFSDKHIRKNKNIKEDVELREKFMKDGEELGFEAKKLEQVWQNICDVVSGGYGFNRSHSASYAKLSFETAYMKLYHPKEFYAAYLTQNKDEVPAITEAIGLMEKRGIKILPPDINHSTENFVPTEGGVLFPLTAIKGVGGSAWYEIKRLQPIKDFDDFLERRVKKFVKRTTIEALVKAGAFDYTGKNRSELLQQFDEEIELASDTKYEKEALGFYLTGNPFSKYSIPDITGKENGAPVNTIMEISELTIRYDKKGGEMAFANGFNDKNTIRLVVFSSVWKFNKFKEGDLVMVSGKKDNENILVSKVTLLEEDDGQSTGNAN